MHVILLERIPKLGQMGDTVRVRDGYARNYLLPQGKALRSTEANQKRFEAERAQLEARNLERKREAESIAERLDGTTITLIRQAGERGQLYGSVTTRDIAEALREEGFTVGRAQVGLNQPIKQVGMTDVPIQLHAEVEAKVSANVARTTDEAERQAKGLSPQADEAEEEEEVSAEQALADAAEFFEDAAQVERLAEEAQEEAGAEEAEPR